MTASQKVIKAVTPAKAGVQNFLVFLDSGFRRNDRKGRFRTFYKFIKVPMTLAISIQFQSLLRTLRKGFCLEV